MSKNKYILPMKDLWYVEYGGITKEFSAKVLLSSEKKREGFPKVEGGNPYS